MLLVRHLFFLIAFLSQAQTPYPQDYFSSPLKQPLLLSGTFAELRSNHFHSGIDIKTNGKEGLDVYAAAAGYVSRIKVSPYGYGKALYITHPNGYTTVYAHLKKFAPKIETYVKSQQYKNEQFEIQLFPKKGELLIKSDEIVALSGNTGGSSGPHLHFEIRDKQERPINPMLFGIDVIDSTKPSLYGLFAYPLGTNSHVDGQTSRKKIRLIKGSNGVYKTEPLKAFGNIGFGIISNDRQDNTSNKNGVAMIQSYFNGQKALEIDFKRFSFEESKHINRFIDYTYFRNHKQRIQKLFIEENNPLSLFTFNENKGQINIEESTNTVFAIDIFDFNGNKTQLKIPILGQFVDLPSKTETISDLRIIRAAKSTTLRSNSVWIDIAANTFYEDLSLDFKVRNDTLVLKPKAIPLQKSISINFNVEKYDENELGQLYIASVSDYGKLYYTPTKRKGDTLTARSKYLGTYTLSSDTNGPIIKAQNFKNGSWLSKKAFLKVKILDVTSGVKNYRATINGNWILMEYDPKTNSITHDFSDGIVNSTENNLKVIVTDNVGNSSKFETTFYRKN
ncbi:MAG: M23 family metallopeptidase [Bacteroidota bacterium]|nr:M23 family metallopeptidase [Bacteroidota bacterium]